MSKIKLRCPHCDYSKDVQRDMIPHEEVRLKCPKCGQSFVFNVRQAEEEALTAAAAATAEEPAYAAPTPPPPSDEPPARPAPQPAQQEEGAEEGVEEKVRAVCPACGFFRKISASLIPPEGKRMKCPRCKESFTVGGPEEDTVAGGPEDADETVVDMAAGGVALGVSAEPPLYAEPADEDNIFGGEAVPADTGEFPPEPGYGQGYGAEDVGELSGHIEAILPEGAADDTVAEAEPYFPARNVPQAEVSAPAEREKPAGGGYSVSLPEDLEEAVAEMAGEEIEVVSEPAEGEGAGDEPEEERYDTRPARRIKSYDTHKYAVTTDLDELLKEPVKKPVVEVEHPEVTTYDIEPKDGGISELSDMGDLMREAWALLRSRAGTFIPLLFSGPLLALASVGVFYAIGAGAGMVLPESDFTFKLTGAGIGALVAVYMISWWIAAFFQAVADETIRTREAFQATFGMASPVMWLTFMLGFVITGGYFLLFVPGLVMSVWYAFSYFILIGEDEHGLSAMIKSREYVRGNWFGVFLRLMPVWVFSAALLVVIPYAAGTIYPRTASLAATLGVLLFLFSLPYLATLCFLVYLDLKDIKGVMKIRPSASSKGKVVVLGAFGFVAPAAVLYLAVTQGAVPAAVRPGLDTENMIANILGTDKDVTAAYMAYSDAVGSKDMAGISARLSGAFLAALEEETDDVPDLLFEDSPRTVDVVSLTFSQSRAYLDLRSHREGGVMVGRAEMVREDGDWVVDSDEWNLTVRPEPIKLSGGQPGPAADPVSVEYLSPGPLFGKVKPERFFDAKTKTITELMRFDAHDSEVTGARFLSDGLRLLTISYFDRSVRLWDVRSGELLDEVSMQNGPLGIDVTPDGGRVILIDSDSNMAFINLKDDTFSPPELFRAYYGRESRFVISPNGMLAATASWDNRVVVWDIINRAELMRIETPEPMRDVAFAPAGDILAASTATNKFILYNLAEGAGRIYTIPDVAPDSDVMSIDISNDSRYLLTGHADSTITQWQMSTQRERANYLVSNSPTWDAVFCPDSMCYATAQQDSNVYLWDTVTSDRLAVLEGHEGGVNVVVFSPDGRLLASGGKDGEVIIWGAVMPQEPIAAFADIAPAELPVPGDEEEDEAVEEEAGEGASLSLAALSYAPGETIVVEFVAPEDALPDAWIGVVPSSVPHGSEAENDEHDVSSVMLNGLGSGSVELEAPSDPGDYDVRMFTSDEGGAEAASAPVQVRE